MRISLLSSDPSSLHSIESVVRATLPHALLQTHSCSAAQAPMVLKELTCDLLILDLGVAPHQSIESVTTWLAAHPGCTLVALCADRSAETILAAMRAGIREVVALPLQESELRTALLRQSDRLRASPAGRSPLGKVLVFMSVKGGSGATFLATSLAHALSRRGKRVGMIDLNLHLGDASIFMSDDPVTSTLADLVVDERRLDGDLLESVMLQCADNLWLLASPESPEYVPGIRPEAVARVIEIAKNRFDFVVVDVPRVPDGVTLKALDAADAIHLVTQSTLPSLHDGKRLVGMLADMGYPRSSLHLVINRAEKRGDLSSADVRETLRFAKAREIPNSYVAVAYAINHGLPVLQHAPRDPVSRALELWAAEWVPDAIVEKSSWLSSFRLTR
jgi:pilus assembly protein CpaE